MSFNVLADDYLRNGKYDYVEPRLLERGARLPGILECIHRQRADVIGLQEATDDVVEALEGDGRWNLFWSRKAGSSRPKPDGCLFLVDRRLTVESIAAYHYSDGSGHVAQLMTINGVVFANTHIRWARRDDPNHVGVSQTKELLKLLGDGRAVIFADCNDRPGGPVRQLIEAAGFTNTISDDMPTAFVNGKELAAIDLLAVRGVPATHIDTGIKVAGIPRVDCTSDHAPIVANIRIN